MPSFVWKCTESKRSFICERYGGVKISANYISSWLFTLLDREKKQPPTPFWVLATQSFYYSLGSSSGKMDLPRFIIHWRLLLLKLWDRSSLQDGIDLWADCKGPRAVAYPSISSSHLMDWKEQYNFMLKKQTKKFFTHYFVILNWIRCLKSNTKWVGWTVGHSHFPQWQPAPIVRF